MILGSILLAGIVIYGGYFLATHQFFINKKMAVEGAALTQERVKKITADLEKDSDNDGLKDWEEALWQTDKNKADTDSDGMQDGEEVRTGHDPLNPAKNDLLIKAENSSSTSSKNNLIKGPTEQLAVDLFSKYLNLHSNNSNPLDQATKDNLIQSVTSSGIINSINLPFTTHTKKDLKVISGQISQADIDTYVAAVKNIIHKNYPGVGDGELLILQKAVDNNDTATLKKLDPIINSYLLSSKNLLSLSVPNTLVQEHLDLVNSFTHMGESISYMKQGFDEPLLVLVDMERYSQFIIDMFQALQAVFQNSPTNQ